MWNFYPYDTNNSIVNYEEIRKVLLAIYYSNYLTSEVIDKRIWFRDCEKMNPSAAKVTTPIQPRLSDETLAIDDVQWY